MAKFASTFTAKFGAGRKPKKGDLTKPILPYHSATDDGIYVTVKVDGASAAVYQPTAIENGKEGWIESIDEQNFTVEAQDRRTLQKEQIVARLSIDGIFIDSAFFTSQSSTFDGQALSGTKIRPFTFGKLNTTDSNERVNATKQNLKNIGSIQLTFHRAVKLGPSSYEWHDKTRSEIVLHEKTKKVKVSHQTKYGKAIEVKPICRVESDYIDPIDRPYASINLHYRSRDVLELNGVVPAQILPPRAPSVELNDDRRSVTLGAVTIFSPKKRTVVVLSDSDDSSDDSTDPEDEKAAEIERLQAKLAKLQKEQSKKVKK